jgi:hypothetical protein
MAIHKKVRQHANNTSDAAQPMFSYDPSKLAPVILAMWADAAYPNCAALARKANGSPTDAALLAAKALINVPVTAANPAGTDFNLARPVIITEAEHDAGWYMDDDTEVVFVLPNKPRVIGGSTQPQLLATAKLLMACTPNGI